MYSIYKATNLINGKVYIGQTVCFERRKAEHLSSKNGIHAKCVFHRAIQKYGKNNFEWEIIDTCDTLDGAVFLESMYIAKYNSCVAINGNNGYNIIYRAEGNNNVHNSRKTIAYDLNGNFVDIFLSCEQASIALGCHSANIIKCLDGKRKSTGAYQFRNYKSNFSRKINAYTTNEHTSKYKQTKKYDKELRLIETYQSQKECADKNECDRRLIERAIKSGKPYKGFYYKN